MARFQRWFGYGTALFAGFGIAAVLLGGLNDASALITDARTALILTGIVLGGWIVIELIVLSRPRWSVPGSTTRLTRIGAIPRLVVLGIVASIWTGVLMQPKAPALEIRYYTVDASGRLLLASDPTIQVDEEQLRSGRMTLPLNLAFHNLDKSTLEGVRVELTYPGNLDVRSAGRAKIDPTARTLIYEHDLGPLDPIESFTPLRTLDTLHLPILFAVVPVVALTKDDVPMFITTVLLMNRENPSVTFGIRVIPQNRPQRSGTITLNFTPSVKVMFPSEETPKLQPVDAAPRVMNVPARMVRMLDTWRAKMQSKDVLYEKFRWSGGTFQRLSVDGVVRRVNVDADSDGRVEYELYHPALIDAVQKAAYQTPYPMTDWPRKAATG